MKLQTKLQKKLVTILSYNLKKNEKERIGKEKKKGTMSS